MIIALFLFACTGTDGGTDDDSGTTDGGTTEPGPPQVRMETTLGTLVFTLAPDQAPVTVDNFLSYVDAGFYDGGDGLGATVIHRVDADFVFQGGIYAEAGNAKVADDPIPLETDVGLSNLRGTLAMARTSDPDSATSSFFVNIVDNTFLDYTDAANPGYAVFGEVVEGLDVVDAIASVEVDGERPVDPIVILAAERVEDGG